MTLRTYLTCFTVRCRFIVLLFTLLLAGPLCAQEQEDEPNWRSNKGIVVTVGTPFIELYTFPGRGYPRYHAVEKNEKIRIFKSRAGWYKVETADGRLGWTPRRALTTVIDEEGFALDFEAPAWGETDDAWMMGILAGSLDDTISYTVYSGYRFTPNISTEIKYTQAFGDFSTVKLAELSLVHQPFPEWRISPFFVWGAGALQTLPDAVLVDAEDQLDSVITVGGGLMVYLTHNLLARIEYNQHTILTTRDNNEEVEEWKAGFSVFF